MSTFDGTNNIGFGLLTLRSIGRSLNLTYWSHRSYWSPPPHIFASYSHLYLKLPLIGYYNWIMLSIFSKFDNFQTIPWARDPAAWNFETSGWVGSMVLARRFLFTWISYFFFFFFFFLYRLHAQIGAKLANELLEGERKINEDADMPIPKAYAQLLRHYLGHLGQKIPLNPASSEISSAVTIFFKYVLWARLSAQQDVFINSALDHNPPRPTMSVTVVVSMSVFNSLSFPLPLKTFGTRFPIISQMIFQWCSRNAFPNKVCQNPRQWEGTFGDK